MSWTPGRVTYSRRPLTETLPQTHIPPQDNFTFLQLDVAPCLVLEAACLLLENEVTMRARDKIWLTTYWLTDIHEPWQTYPDPFLSEGPTRTGCVECATVRTMYPPYGIPDPGEDTSQSTQDEGDVPGYFDPQWSDIEQEDVRVQVDRTYRAFPFGDRPRPSVHERVMRQELWRRHPVRIPQAVMSEKRVRKVLAYITRATARGSERRTFFMTDPVRRRSEGRDSDGDSDADPDADSDSDSDSDSYVEETLLLAEHLTGRPFWTGTAREQRALGERIARTGSDEHPPRRRRRLSPHPLEPPATRVRTAGRNEPPSRGPPPPERTQVPDASDPLVPTLPVAAYVRSDAVNMLLDLRRWRAIDDHTLALMTALRDEPSGHLVDGAIEWFRDVVRRCRLSGQPCGPIDWLCGCVAMAVRQTALRDQDAGEPNAVGPTADGEDTKETGTDTQCHNGT